MQKASSCLLHSLYVSVLNIPAINWCTQIKVNYFLLYLNIHGYITYNNELTLVPKNRGGGDQQFYNPEKSAS